MQDNSSQSGCMFTKEHCDQTRFFLEKMSLYKLHHVFDPRTRNTDSYFGITDI